MNNHINFPALITEYVQLASRLSSKAADLREHAKKASTYDERLALNDRANNLEWLSREKLREAGEMRAFMSDERKENESKTNKPV